MKKRDKIFRQFLYNSRLRFSEIEKLTGMRSNELAYFLKKMMEKGILKKEGEHYVLTKEAERKIPFFQEKGASPLPVILVEVRDKKKVLLVKRSKRPYKDMWSLPGGRILLGESIEEASERIVKEKTFLDVRFEGIKGVANERVIEEGEGKHGFLLIHTDATPISKIKEKPRIRWFSEDEIPNARTIASDHHFIVTDSENIRYNEFVVQN